MFGLSNFAAGANDELQRVIAEKRLMQLQNEARQRQMALDDERRQQNAQVQQRWETDRGDRLERETTARTDKTNAAKAEQAEVDAFIQQNPHLAPVVKALRIGMPVKSTHDLETPDVHGAHEQEAAAARIKGIEQETEAREKVQARYRPAPQPREERLVQIEGPDGRSTWVRESDAVGKPAAQAARAVTGQERGVLAYFNRAKDAEDTISKSDQGGKSLEDRVSGAGLLGQAALQYAPNILQSSDQQAYRQAQRAFTEARLRKESGAAIPTAEYENDAKTYFAQPGDTPETILQKRLKRKTVLDGLKFSSGRAYDEFYGEQSRGGGAGGGAKLSPDELLKKYGGG